MVMKEHEVNLQKLKSDVRKIENIVYQEVPDFSEGIIRKKKDFRIAIENVQNSIYQAQLKLAELNGEIKNANIMVEEKVEKP